METEENTLGVFLKYISKNMLERKGRLFLLIFSIMISTALLIASLGMIDAVVDSFVQPYRIAAEGQDIAIRSNTDEPFFSEEDIKKTGVENLMGTLDVTGVINDNDEVKYVSLVGKKSFDKKMVKGGFENINETNIVISDRIADEYSLKVGDKLAIAIGGKKTDFTVKGISSNDGLFYADKKRDFSAVVPYDYMNELLGANGKYNYMTAKLTDSDAVVKDAVKDFNDDNRSVKASILVDDTTVGTESITMGLYGMLALVCIVCVIIICGAFKLIITERLPIIGTFMSQGATRKKMQHILLMEAGLYAVIGALFGTVLGEFGLALITRGFAPLKDYGIYPPLKINTIHILIGVLFAIVLSVASAWLPARSINKLQVKDVILNRVEQKHKKGAVRFIAGLVLIAFAIAGFASDAQWATDFSAVLFICAFLGVVMASRKLLKILSGIVSRIFRGNTTAFLAMNNIKSSKLLRGNITLLIVSLSAVFAIVSVGNSMKEMVVSAYEELNTDYTVSSIIPSNSETTTTDILIDRLSKVDGIDKDSITPLYAADTQADDYIYFVFAADPDKYAQYMQYFEFDSAKNKDTYEKYKNDTNKGILIGDVVAKNIKKKAGDSIEIEVNGKKDTFKIIGTFDSKVYNNGRVALMKPEDMTGSGVFDMLHNMRQYDDFTYMHSMNVALICNVFAKWLGMSEKDVDILTLGGLLHDIGKLKIPDNIIRKPDKLSPAEYNIIKTHSLQGYNILKDKNIDENVKQCALMHHERCDGSGYPLGLTDSKINSYAKVVAIADVYDAMTAARVYRGPLCPFKVISIFESEGLQKYDSHYILTFLEHVTTTYMNNRVKLNNGMEGDVIFMNRNQYSRPMIQCGDKFIDLSKEPDLYIETFV